MRKRGLTKGCLAGAAPNGGFFDCAPTHIVTTSTLRRIAETAGLPGLNDVRYRPNIVIDDGDSAAFGENGWSGQILTVGSVQLRILLSTPRCAVPMLVHGRVPEASSVLRAVASLNRIEIADIGERPCLGAYGQVVQPGTINIGDQTSLDRAALG